MNDLTYAIELLKTGRFTCVLCKDEKQYTSELRGVKPLVIWVNNNIDLTGFSAADKVVGKATSFLYALLGVESVYASVMSHSALKILSKYGIYASYDTLVEYIINRKGDGICPFEEAVLETDDKNDAYPIIRNKMEQLGITI